MNVKNKLMCDDDQKEGEGRLILTLNATNYVKVGDHRIYFQATNGPNQVRLIFIGPKSTKIDRMDRE